MALPADASASRPQAAVILAVVVAVVVVAAVAIWRWPRSSSRPAPEHVVVIGDSVTYASSPAIFERFEGEIEVDITSRPFYRAIDLAPPLQEVVDARVAAGEPLDRVIVLAGYNDVIRDDRDPSGLPQLLGLADRFDCAVWLTLPARPGGGRAGDEGFAPGEATVWNERVRDLAADRPNVHVSDVWQQVVEADGGDTLLQEDGVHPVRAGHVALADAMFQALEEECPA